MLTYLIRNVKPVIVFILSVFISLIAGYFSFINDFLSLSKFIVFFPFFYLGFCLKPESCKKFLENKYVKLIGVTVMIAFIICCVFFADYVYAMRPVYAAWHSYKEFPFQSIPSFLIRIFQYISSFAIMIGFLVLIPNKNLGILSKSGQHTLPVYFWHYLIIKPIALLYIFSYISNKIGKVDIFVWIILSVAMAIILALPIFDKPLEYLQKAVSIIIKKCLQKTNKIKNYIS